MKKQTLIKSGVMASLLIAGMNLTTSCESCSRKDTHTETTKYVTDTDTVYVDSSSTDTGNSGTSGTGSGTGRSSSATGTSGSSSSGSPGSSSSGSSSTSSSNGKKLTQEEITDEVENSSKTARDANGKPINSGGTSGTGMGTGTGSTGNNSRVSKAEDQKGN
ncbi:hypothetical protein AAEO56_03825 [Flavobacterium sp. DGU11]|uniref:Uncharacterized protein n=1 Tax=Flavobacterium arundinis TaxID=3139143 RepID=A0ABU9HT82_9FLAO